MKYLFTFLFLTLSLQAERHHIAGLEKDLKLSPEVSGRILISELNCTSCHKSDIKGKQAPILNGSEKRLQASFIADYLMNPQIVKEGTTMPDVLHRLPADKKKSVSEAIAVYLTANAPVSAGIKGNKENGAELFRNIGCAACHSSLGEKTGNSVPLGKPSSKYRFEGLRDFLFEPHKVRPSGRMPDMKLSKTEAADIAAYLLSGDRKARSISAAAAEGKKYFEEFNCASCHQKSGHNTPEKLKPLSGPECKGPKFSLDDSRTKMISAALKSKKMTDEDMIKKTLAVNNCYACHERDGIGGPRDKEKFFTTSEGELGQAGRIPPPLTNIGAKLQRSWMRKVLFNGEAMREYMHTRMPQFGEKNIGHLVDLFDKVDKVPAVGLTDVTAREEKKPYREAGWKLVGTEGNNCISCHNYNGYPSLGLKSMDIVSTAKRLKKDWFYHYLINPAAHRPGVVMPSFWPGGKALQKNILGGDTKEQIRAMWHYFTIGQTQRLPKGLHVPPVELKAENQQVRIYRGRSSVAGYRGIAVGFPQKINLAFNAETMNLTSFWKGKFVNVSWRGQAPGNFNPAERSVNFSKGIPFAKLSNDLKWPEMPSKEGKRKENPAPMFVRERGYKFKGYYYDKKKNPVFMYNFGNVEIEDSLEYSDGEIVRTLKLKSPSKSEFHFRAAAAAKIAKSEKGYLIQGSLVIELPEKAEISGESLLMKMSVPKGEISYKIKYRSAL
jgi:mono/diheme cytochrome c family protein